MKKILIACLTAFLCWSCENEIGDLNLESTPTLIVNAILNGQRDDNAVHLYLTGTYETTCISNGVVKLYINGQQAETVTAVYDPYREWNKRYYYPIKSQFKAGDVVRLEAETQDGLYQAWGETRVPASLQSTGVDTLSVLKKPYFDSSFYAPYYQLKLHLQEQSGEAEQYFRLLAGICCTKNYTLTMTEWQRYPGESGGEYVTITKDTTIVDESYQLITREDLALNDGKPQVSDDYIGIIPEIQNHFLIFNNQYFNKGQYTMTISTPKVDTRNTPPSDWGFGISPNEVRLNNARLEIVYHLIAISKEEYHYLKGLSLRMDIDTDDPFSIAPHIIPGNIHGGTGIFAIENWNTMTLELD